jgi:hypothetical protein
MVTNAMTSLFSSIAANGQHWFAQVRGRPLRLPLGRSDLVALACISGTLIFVVSYSAQRFSPAAAIVLIAMAVSALAIGRAVLGILPKLPAGVRAPGEIAGGIAALAVFIWLACAFGGTSAGPAFLGCCAVGLAALVFLAFTHQSQETWTATDLVVLAAICVVSVVWSWEAVRAFPSISAGGPFPVWADYFGQTMHIGQFARYGGPFMSFFHEGSYMLPAALSALARMPAMVATTTLWPVLGFLILGLGAYTTGASLNGRLGGIAASAALLLVPNAAYYGLRNGYFDYHWLEQITTGGGYATGLSLFALALSLVARRERCGRALWLSLAMSACVLLFRSQVFLPLCIAQVLLLLFFWRPASNWVRVAGLLGVLLTLTAGVLLAQIIPRAPHLLTDGPPHPLWFIREMLALGPVGQLVAFDGLEAVVPRWVLLAVGLLYVLFASCGAMLLVFTVGFVWSSRHGMFRIERWYPVAVLAAYLLIILMVPPTKRSSPMEMQHRAFVLVYAVLAVWCGAMATAFLRARSHRLAAAVVPTAALLLLPIPFLLSPTAQYPHGFGREPTANWARPYVGLMLPPGFFQAATFLREHAAPTDTVTTATVYLCGPLQAIVERWVVLPEECDPRSITPRSTIPERPTPPHSYQADLLAAPNYPAFAALARAQGIDWFFLYAVSPPAAWIEENSLWHDGRIFILPVRSPGGPKS